ncbi:MAG: SIS domain-containing protein, partial [Candidatus Eisenbacteria bacterium]
WADQAKLECPCLVILGGVERARDARGRVIDAAERELRDLGFDLLRVPPYGDSRLERLLAQVFLGDRVSVDLARLSGVDPVPVGAIDRLKREVATAPPKGGEEDR